MCHSERSEESKPPTGAAVLDSSLRCAPVQNDINGGPHRPGNHIIPIIQNPLHPSSQFLFV